MRHMVHLSPPDGVAPIRMDRFSPNFTEWRARGFTSLAPMPAYRHVFDFGPDDLAQIAYYFRYDHPQLESARRAGEELYLIRRRMAAKTPGRRAGRAHGGAAR